MIPATPLTVQTHESVSFTDYKKKISNKLRAKAAYAAAIGQNVFSNFDLRESQLGKALPKTV